MPQLVEDKHDIKKISQEKEGSIRNEDKTRPAEGDN